MRFDGQRLIIETPEEGTVVAELGDIGCGSYNTLAETYRDIKEDRLPATLGKMATGDVIKGLKIIVKEDLTIDGYLGPEQAIEYLEQLGLADTI